jgi:hypothetical protein
MRALVPCLPAVALRPTGSGRWSVPRRGVGGRRSTVHPGTRRIQGVAGPGRHLAPVPAVGVSRPSVGLDRHRIVLAAERGEIRRATRRV